MPETVPTDPAAARLAPGDTERARALLAGE